MENMQIRIAFFALILVVARPGAAQKSPLYAPIRNNDLTALKQLMRADALISALAGSLHAKLPVLFAHWQEYSSLALNSISTTLARRIGNYSA